MRLFGRPETSILLVCTANICRSPMAEGVLRFELNQRGMQRQIGVDSAGTHASQAGRAADPRAQKICRREGIDIRKCRARQIRQADFQRFDYILAMDHQNQRWLRDASPDSYRGRISLVGSWGDDGGPFEIPDPYYGSQQGFVAVYSSLHTALEAFVAKELAG